MIINSWEEISIQFEKMKEKLERAKIEYQMKVEEITKEVYNVFRNLSLEGRKINDKLLLNILLNDYVRYQNGNGKMEVIKEIDIDAKTNERIIFAKYGDYKVLLRITYKTTENSPAILNFEAYFI